MSAQPIVYCGEMSWSQSPKSGSHAPWPLGSKAPAAILQGLGVQTGGLVTWPSGRHEGACWPAGQAPQGRLPAASLGKCGSALFTPVQGLLCGWNQRYFLMLPK